MTRCEDVRKELDGAAGEKVFPPEQLADHLISCSGCSRYARLVRTIDSALRKGSMPEIPPGLLARLDEIPSLSPPQSPVRERIPLAGILALIFGSAAILSAPLLPPPWQTIFQVGVLTLGNTWLMVCVLKPGLVAPHR